MLGGRIEGILLDWGLMGGEIGFGGLRFVWIFVLIFFLFFGVFSIFLVFIMFVF